MVEDFVEECRRYRRSKKVYKRRVDERREPGDEGLKGLRLGLLEEYKGKPTRFSSHGPMLSTRVGTGRRV